VVSQSGLAPARRQPSAPATAPDPFNSGMPPFSRALAALLAGALAIFSVGVRRAEALPAFARQTDLPCSACHTAFPELTPFGRRFKIGGYTLRGGDWKGPPLAAMYMTGFTHTNSPQDAPPAAGLRTNDNLVSQQVSGFVAGQLYGNLGSFIQVTGNPVAGTAGLDASDVRYADTLKLFGKDMVWGIDANNTPTVEDPWNTTPAFGWPQIASTVAPAFAPPLTHIEGAQPLSDGRRVWHVRADRPAPPIWHRHRQLSRYWLRLAIPA